MMVDLSGAWTLADGSGEYAVDATVPGCVHLDLRAAGRIPDYTWRQNDEHELSWIAERDWIYARAFDVPPALLAEKNLELVCEGLDTLAAIEINGRRVGATDNMFRSWRFDARPFLRAGPNRIAIRFASALAYCREAQKRRWLKHGGDGIHAHVRKEPCNFGWDWSPRLITCGIWRPIRLEARSASRLEGVRVQQRHTRNRVRLCLGAAVRHIGAATGMTLRYRLTYGGREVAAAEVAAARGGKAELTVRAPKLWWPNGMGAQPRYTLTTLLRDADGHECDRHVQRLGLRTLELVREKDARGESFFFRANGRAFFAKGANWVPPEVFAAAVTEAQLRRLLADAAAAHMNMLRVWGGGIYEQDAFYDLCDELGVTVWQDFMFACAAYPADDPAFMANVKREAVEQVRRLRHHACIALWCGNNELEMNDKTRRHPDWVEGRMPWKLYRALFDQLLGGVVQREAPGASYWPSSPTSPAADRRTPNCPQSGDAHTWDVGNGGVALEVQNRYDHRFISEFGLESFAHPATIASFSEPGDRCLNGPVMLNHEKNTGAVARHARYLLERFRQPRDFESWVWLSQIVHGIGLQIGVENMRRRVPHSMGALAWMLDDTWPANGFSAIDYRGYRKAPYYYLKRAFAPVVLRLEPNAGWNRIFASAINEGAPFHGRFQWQLTDLAGAELARGAQAIRLGTLESRELDYVNLRPLAPGHHMEEVLFWGALVDASGRVAARALSAVRPFSAMELPDPKVTARVRRDGRGGIQIALRCQRPAPLVWCDLADRPSRFSDNFFPLHPAEEYEVILEQPAGLTIAQVRSALKVRSLFDTVALTR